MGIIINQYSFSSFDSDALAFIIAAGLTNSTQKSAINDLVLNLKSSNIWTKFNAIYPMIGGTGTSHKYNLKNPIDSDAAFRLAFNGSWTHSSTGALPDGSTAYAITYITPTTPLLLNNTYMCYYSRNNINSGGFTLDMGAGSAISEHHLGGRVNGSMFGTLNQFNNSSSTAADSLALYSASRTASNAISHYKRGISIADLTDASTTQNILNIFLGASNDQGSANYFSSRECAYAAIGDGLTASEELLHYTAVQAYQTTLNRNV